MKRYFFLSFVFLTSTLFSQIDTNRSVNGWKVVERSPNITSAYSEMVYGDVYAYLVQESKYSQKFTMTQTGTGGTVTWEKMLPEPIMNRPNDASVIWVDTKSIGGPAPSWAYIYLKFFWLVDSVWMSQENYYWVINNFPPGWEPNSLGGSLPLLGPNYIRGVRIQFLMFSHADVSISFDEMGFFDGNHLTFPIDRFEDTTILGIEERGGVPSEFILFQNYPNPFNPVTTIKFSLPQSERITLTIFNMLGEKVTTLIDREEIFPGVHEVHFNASDLPSGIYFYRLQSRNFSETKKMILMK